MIEYYKDLYEERAGILQFDAADKYKTKEAAEEAAMSQIKQQYTKDQKLPYYGAKCAASQIASTDNKIRKLAREIRKLII